MEIILNNITELLLLVFIAIVFLQSGLDKAFDWKGNTGWLKEHFGKTFLKGIVPLLVGTVMITEILSGIFAIMGIFEIIFFDSYNWAFRAAILATLTLLMLLFGQRIAKDYPGAFTIVGYFLVCIIAVYLFA